MILCYREILFIIFDTDEIQMEFFILREFVKGRVCINELLKSNGELDFALQNFEFPCGQMNFFCEYLIGLVPYPPI